MQPEQYDSIKARTVTAMEYVLELSYGSDWIAYMINQFMNTVCSYACTADTTSCVRNCEITETSASTNISTVVIIMALWSTPTKNNFTNQTNY